MKSIEIGTKFRKQVSGGKYVDCTVYDIFDVTYFSRKNGSSSTHTIYTAKSDNFSLGDAFEVSKTTILRGL